MPNSAVDQVLKAKAEYESKKQAAIDELLAKKADIEAQLVDLGYSESGRSSRRGRRGPVSEETRQKMRDAWRRRKEAGKKPKK
jgi:hypothetical protein